MAVSRHKEINTINLIVLQAEQDIYAETGERVRLIVANEQNHRSDEEEERLFRLICAVMNLSPSCVRSSGQADSFVMARYLFYYFSKKHLKTTHQKLGEVTGGHDHATVSHGIRQVEQRAALKENGFMENYEAVNDAVEQWLKDK